MKILSIVIPVYNTEKYIERCLSSLLIKEVVDDLEIIAVNDGSKDNSIVLLNKFKADYPNSIIVIDKENGGHGSTINAALKVATGKYFKVLDSDDWFDSCHLITCIQALKKFDDDVIVFPYTEEFAYVGTNTLYTYKDIKWNKTIFLDKVKIDDPSKIYFPMAAATYKLDILKKCNLSLFEHTFYVDMQYNIMPIPFVNTVRYFDKPLYRYFIGRSSQSMSQESLIRNYQHHQKVLMFLVEYFARYADKVTSVKREYMKFIVTSMIYTFFTIVCIQLKNKKKAYKTITDFDSFLKNTSFELYEASNIYSYIRFSRKFKYLNVKYFMKLFMDFINIIREMGTNKS